MTDFQRAMKLRMSGSSLASSGPASIRNFFTTDAGAPPVPTIPEEYVPASERPDFHLGDYDFHDSEAETKVAVDHTIKNPDQKAPQERLWSRSIQKPYSAVDKNWYTAPKGSRPGEIPSNEADVPHLKTVLANSPTVEVQHDQTLLLSCKGSISDASSKSSVRRTELPAVYGPSEFVPSRPAPQPPARPSHAKAVFDGAPKQGEVIKSEAAPKKSGRLFKTKPKISAPIKTTFRDFTPTQTSPLFLHSEVKAISLGEAQAKFLGHPELTPGWNDDPKQLSKAKSVKKQRAVYRPPAKQPAKQPVAPVPREKRPVKVIGHPSRDTCFGDFVNYVSLNDSEESVAGPSRPSNRDKPLPELPSDTDAVFDNQPSITHGDLKHRPTRAAAHAHRKGKGPFERPSSASPSPPTSKSRPTTMWPSDFSPNETFDPDLDDLFIDDTECPEEGKPWAAEEARRLRDVSRRPTPERGEELMIDTFVRNGHTSWRATERPSDGVVHSDHRKVDGGGYDNSEGRAEAARMQERLRKMRDGRGRSWKDV